MKKVRCINNLGFENRLEENKIYTVTKEINGRYILEEVGDAYEFGSERFEEVEEKKGLNIIEATKMPVGTEFEVIFNGEKIENNTMIIYRSLGDKECKHIDWKCHPQDTFIKPYDFLINGTFIPIQKPINFSEAILHGKKIKVEHSLLLTCEMYEHYFYLKDLIWNLSNDFDTDSIADILTNGNFYIKE